MSTTYGEREGEITLASAWEILGGLPCSGLCGYVEDLISFEMNRDYTVIITVLMFINIITLYRYTKFCQYFLHFINYVQGGVVQQSPSLLGARMQEPAGKLIYQGIHGCADILVSGDAFLLGKNAQQAAGIIEAEGISRLHAKISK